MPGAAEAVVILIIIVFIGGWIWTVIDCASKETDEGNQRLIWLLVIVIAGQLGAIAYLIARRPARKRALGR